MRPFPWPVADLVHLAGQPPRVHRDHDLGARGELPLGVVQVEARRLGVDINEDRHVAEEAQRQAGGEEGVGRHQDVGAGRQVEGEEHARQSAGAVHVRFDERRLGVLLPFLLELRQLFIELAAVDHVVQRLLLRRPVARPAGQRGLLGHREGDRLGTAKQRQRSASRCGGGLHRGAQPHKPRALADKRPPGLRTEQFRHLPLSLRPVQRPIRFRIASLMRASDPGAA